MPDVSIIYQLKVNDKLTVERTMLLTANVFVKKIWYMESQMVSYQLNLL